MDKIMLTRMDEAVIQHENGVKSAVDCYYVI